MSDDDDLEAILDDIEENEDHLSQREREFVDDIQHLLGEGRDPTENQLDWLRRIRRRLVHGR